MNVNTRSTNIHHHQQQPNYQHHQGQPQQRQSNINNSNHLNHNNHNVGHHQSHPNSAPNRQINNNTMNGGVNRVNRPNHPGQVGQQHHSMHNNNNNTNNSHHGQAAPQRQPQSSAHQQQQQRGHHQNMAQHAPQNQRASSAQGGTTQNAQAPPPVNNNMPPLPQVLPKGWKKEEIVRTKGISSGIVDVVYAPSASSEQANPELAGKKFRNKLELHKFFGEKYDMALLDYKSGKVSQVVWRKQRRLKSMITNIASASKYDTYLNLPIRQTASIFKQPVNLVTNNHKNDPTPSHVLNANMPNQSANNSNNNGKPSEKPKPVQLFWELRFNELKAVDPNMTPEDNELANIQKELELTKISKFKNFETSNETALRSVAVACYLNPNKILIGQDKEFSKNARVYIDRDQPLIPAVSIKEEDIKQQEAKLKEIRKKLKLAIEDLENMDIEAGEMPEFKLGDVY